MAKKPATDVKPTEGPLDHKVFNLDNEQAREFLKDLTNPPPANEALTTLMKRPSPWQEGSRIEDLFGMLKREGRRLIIIEEMNEAVVGQAMKEDEHIKKI